METSFGSHLQEDVLERYAMGTLSEQESAPVEEHLLICSACQNALAEIDEYICVARSATAAMSRKPPTGARRLTRPGAAAWNVPKPVWSLGLAVVLLLLALPWYQRPDPVTEIVLTANRGPSLPQATANSRVLLRIDVTQIAGPAHYQLELVDPTGNPVWRSTVAARNNQVIVTVPNRLPPGQYWVRLYDSAQPPTLRREYGLEVK